MADNIELSAGTGGAVIATDDITSIHYQINKLAFGALDSATLAAGGAGAVTAGVQRVTLASDDPAVASLAIIDNMVFGAGTEAAAQRVTIATDSTGVLSVDDNGGSLTVDGTVAVTNAGITTIAGAVSGTEMQVDVVAALPAGTNAIGKLAANSGVDIGDVDVTSISAGTNNIGNVGLIPRTSGGMTIFNSIDLDESEEEIKATAGQVFSIAAFNHTNAPLYLRFYNATAANTTVGTTAAHVGPFTVPGNNDTDGAGFIWNNEIGIAFGTAISAAVTTGIAANDTGAPAANACSVVVGYA